MTPERKAEVEALLDDILGPEPKPQPPKPKVVVDAGAVVRDADVVVSPRDVNAERRGGDTGVVVRRPTQMVEAPLPPIRPGEVRIDLGAAQRQWEINRADRLADRAHRRQIDPFDYGHWGPRDE
ncbi:hypothetical protein ACMA5K_01415 [Bradyrhizobium diazoefficiens]|uniref:hypothetical protein n=1 Tax=Bradyrhizobium diazoefficiens TaxID=1355477 RepID=UPI000BE9FAE7|nr:hypothetical protein [Bradyrhizobium diazoefficiens]PDT62575.1 hypothetical protein CO678_09055 [Bradyrhizobium diazoefficiens]QLD39777.1 hypothetical protein HUW42_01405 [Bradyrhizobium diazoefficiens]